MGWVGIVFYALLGSPWGGLGLIFMHFWGRPGLAWPDLPRSGKARPGQGLKPSYVTKRVGGWVLVRITPVMQNILKNSLHLGAVFDDFGCFDSFVDFL